MSARIVLFSLLLLPLLLSVQTHAAPSQEPILRIEAGMHTATVNSVSVSRGGTLMVTGSDDKTIRVWSLPDGSPVKTLRIPMEPRNGGNIFAVALSPDDRSVAAGGFDSGASFVYIIDLKSGMMENLGSLPGDVETIVYSRDGRRLAVGLGASSGFRVWDPVSGALISEDRAIGGDVYGLSFDGDGRLVVCSTDGYVRLYDTAFHRIAIARATGGKQPARADFAADGQKIAIGYFDSPAVDVFNGTTLSKMFSADTSGLNGALGAVTWSRDGKSLFAGGTSFIPTSGNGLFPIFRWQQGGQGRRETLGGPSSTIMDLSAWGQSGVAFTSAEPSFGLFDRGGKKVFYRGAPGADMRSVYGDNFLVSADGKQVLLGAADNQPWLLDASAGRFGPSENSRNFHPARADGLGVTDWQGNSTPKFGSGVLDLGNDTAQSLTALPEGFILGASFSLQRFDAKGNRRWSVAAPGLTCAVNTSSDGKIIVAAYSDGTIRWHRASDGQELLAFFIDMPKDPSVPNRWVLWTPKGYYMASPGGEDLIGWHVNRASWDEAPDFYRASRFRDQFYRPDVVQRVLDTLDEEDAIMSANARAGLQRGSEDIRADAPPTINILSPNSGDTFHEPTVTLTYNAKLPNEKPLTDVEVLIDGEKMGSRGVEDSTKSGPQSLTLNLPPHDVIVTVIGSAGMRMSEPAAIKLRWDGKRIEEKKQVVLHALLVGESNYQHGLKSLTYPAKDARDMDAVLKAQEGKAYARVETMLLPDATRRDIIHGFEWLRTVSDPNGVSLIFLAGHGLMDSAQQFYFLPSDTERADIASTAIENDRLMKTLRLLKGRVVVFLDACHGAEGFNSGAGPLFTPDTDRITNEVTSPEIGGMMYAAATGRQLAWEGLNGIENGVFTHAVIEGLSGKADYNGDGVVETDELGVWIRQEVMKQTNKAQEPIAWGPRLAPPFTLATLH